MSQRADKVFRKAHKRLTEYRATVSTPQPILDAQIELLRLAVEGMDHMSPELVTLHNTYWMALHILGKTYKPRPAPTYRN